MEKRNLPADAAATMTCEFLEAAVHSLLSILGIYPSDTFERRRYCSVPVQWARHPELAEYIHSSVFNLHSWIREGVIEQVAVLVMDHNRSPVERFVFKFTMNPLFTKEFPLEEVQSALRGFLLKLSTCQHLLSRLPPGCSWEMVAFSKQHPDRIVSQSWIPAAFGTWEHPPLISPIKSLSCEPLSMQLYLEQPAKALSESPAASCCTWPKFPMSPRCDLSTYVNLSSIRKQYRRSCSLQDMVGVKGLVDSGIARVPEEYVRQDVEHLNQRVVELPLVDFSQDEAVVRVQIHKACQEWGTFQLVQHEIPPELLKKTSKLVNSFFEAPEEERMAFYSEDRSKPVRFGTSFQPQNGGAGGLQLWHDYLYHICNPPFRPEDVPSNVPHYWDIVTEYNNRMMLLAKKIFRMLSESLDLPPETLEKQHDNPWHVVKMNYYPPCPNPTATIGIHAHTDSGGLTILQPDDCVEGLQVFHNGEWWTVKPVEGALVINVADQLEILSNGVYKSLVHRAALNSTRTRISIASFFAPNVDTCIGPLTADPARYRSCKYGDYRKIFFENAFSERSAISIMRTY